jgi:hypothetical protein
MPVPGVLIDMFLSADGSYSISGTSNALGYYRLARTISIPISWQRKRVTAIYDQVYSGFPAQRPGLLRIVRADRRNARVGQQWKLAAAHRRFVLQSRDPIFANGFE